MDIHTLLVLGKSKDIEDDGTDTLREESRVFAQNARVMVEELESVGFTTEQAMEIFKTIITNTLLRDEGGD